MYVAIAAQQLLMGKVTLEWRAQCLGDVPGVAVHRYEPEILAVIGRQAAIFGAAERVRLLQYRVEYRGELARRAVDDLHDLGNRGLLSQRFVALGRERGEFASQRDYGLVGVNLCVIGHRLRLPRTIACDDTLLPPLLPARVRPGSVPSLLLSQFSASAFG